MRCDVGRRVTVRTTPVGLLGYLRSIHGGPSTTRLSAQATAELAHAQETTIYPTGFEAMQLIEI